MPSGEMSATLKYLSMTGDAVPPSAGTFKSRGTPDRWPVGRWVTRWRALGRRAERLYAAAVTLLGGAWVTAATAVGPSRPPLPTVALLGTIAAGLPWWTHHRRRARVRVERTIAAWPTFAAA